MSFFSLISSSPGNVGLVPGDRQPRGHDPVEQVVVLAAPAPELVAEPVDRPEVARAHGDGAAEDAIVGQVVVELVHGWDNKKYLKN